MKHVLCILFVLFGIGCSPIKEIVVSPDETPEFILAVKTARDAWCEADKTSPSCIPMKVSHEGVNISFEESEDKTYYGMTHVTMFGTSIVIRSQCPPDIRAWTIAHEIGHATTLRHDHSEDGWITLAGNIVKREDRNPVVISPDDVKWSKGE